MSRQQPSTLVKHAHNFQDLTDQIFHRLTVISYNHTKGKIPMWNCKCECYNFALVSGKSLKSGNTKSCGCLMEEVRGIRHGLYYTKEYKTWWAIKDRCYNPNNKEYFRYGGQNVKMSNEWLHGGVIQLIKDRGLAPGSEYSIDRYPDPYGDYTAENTRWATPIEQANNKRPTKKSTKPLKGLTVVKRICNQCGNSHWRAPSCPCIFCTRKCYVKYCQRTNIMCIPNHKEYVT